MTDVKQRLLETIDCTKEFPSDKFFSYGDVKVVKGPAGKYRECEGKPLSRFGYRFQIEHVGKPHVAVIRYPDDKRRFIIINDGTTYDLSTGITTGWAQPLSNKMLELKQVFWPRWKDCSIVFMTWGHGEPAAAGSVEIYELDELSALDVPASSRDKSRREFGIQYEDPCGTGYSEGATTYEQWLDHVVTYAKHTGQKLLSYPICWYHGPIFPSEREPADCFSVVAGEDRKIYSPWTTEPPDWPAVLLERFGKEGLEFQGVLTLLRLGSLMKKMNIDLDAIKGGAETFNNMLWNDQVQAGTGDWTPTYNARNYSKRVEYYEADKDEGDFPWAYGEKIRQPYHPGPMFNPLHPVVQEAIVGFVDEIAQRYGKYKAFKGIAITMWAPTLIWFGSIHSGYDDFTVGLFEKETGVEVPVDKKAPDRFSKRYEFLTFNCKPAWVAWRCRKIRELIRKMRDAMVKHRKDLRLTLNLWQEPYVPALLGLGKVQQQIHARPNGVTLWREAGLDLNLLRDEPNVELDLQTEGGQRDRTWSLEENTTVANFCMFRDHDYLDQETLDAVHAKEKSGVFIFNAWHEAWGKHKWFTPDPNDPQIGQVEFTYGKKAEGIFVINSEYPKDGFWWDSQLRITHAFQPGVHFMEQYAHAVAEVDALRITRGGLFLDKAHSEELRKFALAFRALPAKKFETVGFSTDPVVVRTVVADGKRYFYMINRDYYPVDVEVQFGAAPKKLTDLAKNEAIKAGKKWKVKLGPYELRSLAVDAKVQIDDFRVVVPAKIGAGILKDAQKALKAIQTVEAKGRFVPGMDKMAALIGQAIDLKRYAWLRRALTSFTIRKCRQIAES